MNPLKYPIVLALLLALTGCAEHEAMEDHGTESHEDVIGTHGGNVLSNEGFSLEISIFENGVPAEFRVWATTDGEQVDPREVQLSISLSRLGGITDDIGFVAETDYLRSDVEIYEPHSFAVSISARHADKTYSWQYESFEGRTSISKSLVAAAGIKTEMVGPATIQDYATLYGQVVSNPEGISHVVARFEGVIQSVRASIGDHVAQGDILAIVEANDSLKSYEIRSPIAGTVVERHANPGESTAERTLFTIIDTRTVLAELAVFPSDRARIKVGATVKIRTAIGGIEAQGVVRLLSPLANGNQSVTAQMLLDNPDGLLTAGMYLTGEVKIAQHDVPIAVRRSGIQPFRDFNVVFAQFDDSFEVRMLDLGRQDEEWAEVLGGISIGTNYVTTNSYIIKADIEKSGASHDH